MVTASGQPSVLPPLQTHASPVDAIRIEALYMKYYMQGEHLRLPAQLPLSIARRYLREREVKISLESSSLISGRADSGICSSRTTVVKSASNVITLRVHFPARNINN